MPESEKISAHLLSVKKIHYIITDAMLQLVTAEHASRIAQILDQKCHSSFSNLTN
jgi:hypothetical protein